jgi:hypothetical protein
MDRMRLLAICSALLFGFACNSSSSSPDAKVYMDGSGSGSGSGNVCTGQLYDSCNPAASNCMTGLMCKTFSGSSFSVCTQTCSGSCPGGATCNNMGICKPTAANSCTPP